MVLQALAQTQAEASMENNLTAVPQQLPKGGFTDVGLHTGGQPRDTAWPLVCQTIKVGGGLRCVVDNAYVRCLHGVPVSLVITTICWATLA